MAHGFRQKRRAEFAQGGSGKHSGVAYEQGSRLKHRCGWRARRVHESHRGPSIHASFPTGSHDARACVMLVRVRASVCARMRARVTGCGGACARADDPDAAEDAGDAEGAHGADDDDGHVERAQRREGEGHHDEVEPAIIFMHAYMYACRNSICVSHTEERRMERKKEGEGVGTGRMGDGCEDRWREAWREPGKQLVNLRGTAPPSARFPSQQGDWPDGIDQPVSFTDGGGGSDGGN